MEPQQWRTGAILGVIAALFIGLAIKTNLGHLFTFDSDAKTEEYFDDLGDSEYEAMIAAAEEAIENWLSTDTPRISTFNAPRTSTETDGIPKPLRYLDPSRVVISEKQVLLAFYHSFDSGPQITLDKTGGAWEVTSSFNEFEAPRLLYRQ
ncbi:hypothetical protein AAFN60_21180 [Roseibacillus persicicus]|uniref:hypothetical protein n=1 Tax=Roseibacillus persicicus TaxID=454148 RepID=UPI00398BB77D